MKTKLSGVLAVVLALTLALSGCASKSEPVSDTVNWFNTSYAALTAANKGDFNAIGGFKKTSSSTKLVLAILEQSWDVTDRASADETIEYLLQEGHRSDFNAALAEIEASGTLDLTDEELQAAGIENSSLIINCIAAYKKYGENAIAAWDYCRILQLYGFYYVADLYTEQEALDASLEVAKELQTMYTSWDDLMQSYLYGYQYWQEDDASDPESATAERTAVYEELKAGKENPYGLDWNTPLVKTW